MYRLMFGKRGHKPDRKIVETGECDIGKTFNYRLCLMRHLSKNRLAAEGKLLDYNPCTHCPLILKAIAKEKAMHTNHVISNIHIEDMTNSHATAKAGEVARCKHCHKDKRIQGRGLCANCYRDIPTRNKYPAKNTGRPPKERTPCRGCERRLTTLVDGLCPGCTKIAKNLGLTHAVKKDESKEVLLNQLKVSLEYSAHLIELALKKGTD